MSTLTAKIFTNGRNQAVRIPKELSFDTDTVAIEKRDDGLLLRPVYTGGWDSFFADESLVVSSDFDPGEDLPPQDRDLF